MVAEVAVFEAASVITTVSAPLGTAGTVKVTAEDPLAPVAAPPVMVPEVPSTVTVRSELGANP